MAPINSVAFHLPSWLEGFIRAAPAMSTDEERMSFVLAAASRNIDEQTGGPFAAGVFDRHSGELLSVGVNLVLSEKLSILHAEIVAIALAQKALSTHDLGSLAGRQFELMSSTEPCAMCLGAVHWSGISRLVTAATDADARAIGFDEGVKHSQWVSEFQQRGIAVVTGVNQPEGRAVLQRSLIHI